MILKSIMNVWWGNRLFIRFYQKQKAEKMRTRSDIYTFSHI